ncbi:osmotically inducible protein OsmC [Flavobacterium gossypii]|jgi:peroxiredoxin, OsmC subfamily|uniref:Osmotically inducible protein OsmC n=1 Tax=Flavobacterium gossypii TaxID=1646119 RepID=A0ABR6DL58_9FLAO|nr:MULTISPECIES: OsmC family protein [Flavobacterium]MBA9072081.1 osmotically inducible protein OsmC [Flavobacterium gossypii]WDO12574.1 OsmC family protein [Flavobacterium sp. WW92]
MKRNATAVWEGSLKEGNGKISTQSTVLSNAQYSFKTRFEQGNGTNPEELIAAAHAGCFTMQLTAYLNEAGFTVASIETKCDVDFQDGSVVGSHLSVLARVDDISTDKFQELVKKAETTCPISRLLNTKITSNATLVLP